MNSQPHSLYGNRVFKWIRRAFAGSPAMRTKNAVALALDILAVNGVTDISIPFATGGRVHLSTKDRMISTIVINTGGFGQPEIANFVNRLSKLGFNPADVLFVNVGANIGMTSRHAYDAGIRKILAIEPDPENFRLLNLNLNALPGASVQMLQIAAGENSGQATLHLDPNNLGAHSLLSRSQSTKETITVSVEPLSALLKTADAFVLFVDAEGFEPQIIRGAGDALTRSCLAVVLEITPAQYSERDADDLIQRLQEFGTEIRLLATGDILPWGEFEKKVKAKTLGYFDIFVLKANLTM
jgi:FkbM family methyltransferase